MNSDSHRLLIFGCGFLGSRVAALWRDRGGSVSAVTRQADKAARLAAQGIEPVLADLMHPATLTALPSVSRVLYCVGHDRSSPWSKESVYMEGLTHVLDALQGRFDRFVYVSSSSVYGQDDGSWVDESSTTEPTTEGGRICLAAEQRLRERSESATILRLSGLYGPDRLLARIEQLQAGEPIGGNPDAWLNLIHGDDAARAGVAVLSAPAPGRLYLVSDDRPITRREYFTELAKRVNAPPPQFSREPTSRSTSEGLNKRCRNDKLKRELPLEWLYADISQGLRSQSPDTSPLAR